MFKTLRELPISLAAKCQLLFGAAVALIIAAALLVPWQRMEQLTTQINERTARALAQATINEHLAMQSLGKPTTGASHFDPSLMPTTSPALTDRLLSEGRAATIARLVLLEPKSRATELSSFEKHAAEFFAHNPDMQATSHLYKHSPDGSPRYRYAMAIRADEGCMRCHAAIEAAQPGTAAGTGMPLASSPWSEILTSPRASQRATTSGVHAAGPTTAPLFAAARAAAPSVSAATAPAAGEPLPLIGMVSIDMGSQVETSQIFLNRIFMLAAGLLAGTLAVFVFYLITTRLILQPVHVLQETAEKVSAGDLNIRSHISTGDEFQQLSETFNVMLANLKASQDQLRSINKSLDLKLGQLAESNVALYESNRLKSEFLANVSHELRTPLNSILGFAELLHDINDGAAGGSGSTGGQNNGGGHGAANGGGSIAGNASGKISSTAIAGVSSGQAGRASDTLATGNVVGAIEPRMTRYIQNILTSGRNLLELINDLLDLAKIEAGRMEVRSEPLSLPDLFEGLTNILKPLAEKKHLLIAAYVAPDVPILLTDGPKLQQVLYNLLSNAIKFSPPEGRIDLQAECEPSGDIRISVVDRGPGIEREKQDLIFEKFRQIDGSATREHGGTGLGLAISRELISLLSGRIGIESSPGQGAAFWIVLPRKIQPGAQDLRQNLTLS